MSAQLYFHSSEQMPEIEDSSVKLLVGASVYLGSKTPWNAYADLYRKVYIENGLRILKPDGIFIVLQTNPYRAGGVFSRYYHLLELLLPAGWKLLDEKIWERGSVNFYQLPFSHVFVFGPPKGAVKRGDLMKNKDYRKGVWRYPQKKGGADNGYPDALCNLLVETTTQAGDLVCDPFAGSGRLLRVASRLGRKSIGYEVDQKMLPLLDNNGVTVIGAPVLAKKGLVC